MPLNVARDLAGRCSCPSGKYEAATASEECSPCEISRFCEEGASAGMPCAAGTVRTSVGAASQADCEPAPIGHYGQDGVKVPCAEATYADQVGTESQQMCTQCPDRSITTGGATSITDCSCTSPFILDESSGTRECVCVSLQA